MTAFATLAREGVTKYEAVHLIDAMGAACPVFLTTDKRDFFRAARREAIERIAGLDVRSPDQFLATFVEPTSDGAGCSGKPYGG